MGGPKRKVSLKTYQITKKFKLFALNLNEPSDYNDIFNMNDKDLWIDAINNELKSLKDMNVYVLLIVYLKTLMSFHVAGFSNTRGIRKEILSKERQDLLSGDLPNNME